MAGSLEATRGPTGSQLEMYEEVGTGDAIQRAAHKKELSHA
jgi:hypothetical protein